MEKIPTTSPFPSLEKIHQTRFFEEILDSLTIVPKKKPNS